MAHDRTKRRDAAGLLVALALFGAGGLAAGQAPARFDGFPLSDWVVEGEQPGGAFGRVAAAGDVNGDGYDEVLVGAPSYDLGEENEGAALLFYGAAEGPAQVPAWTGQGDQAEAQFGWSLGTAGDVNGDGYDDVIVGAPRYDHAANNDGAAFVYYGSAAGLSPSPDWMTPGAMDVASIGWSVGTAGDVNGDGYDDVIIGAPYYTDFWEEGAVMIFYGSSTGLGATADWMAVGDQWEGYFGMAVGTAGDVNGDGYDDVLAAAPEEHYPAAVYAFYGSPSGPSPVPDWTVESDYYYSCFGCSLATAGDVDGDGYDDVLIGAPWYENDQPEEGRAWLYRGSETGLGPEADWIGEGNADEAHFGGSVSAAGDLDADGYDDFLVSSGTGTLAPDPGWRVFVYYGSAAGSGPDPGWTLGGPGDGRGGPRARSALDLNGDGYPDTLLGSSSAADGRGTASSYHSPAAEQPVAGLEAANDSPTLLGRPTTLSASVTAGTYLTFTWDLGDQTSGAGQVISHTYPATGLYTALVTARNSAGLLTATTRVTISLPVAPVFHVYLPLLVR